MAASGPTDLAAGVLAGDRRSVARAISIIEAGGPDAAVLTAAVHPASGHAYTLGVTGAPGAGKSTLTDRLLGELRTSGDTAGVLAIDPSSPFTGGAILGDRIRMESHSGDDGVFVRSMATRGHLGGLALATPQAARVLDAAGFDWVVIETVGVGQIEVDIVGAADTTVVVLNPGWGDGVQAAKAGLMEIADVFVVNKADRPGTADTVREITSMLDLGAGARADGWRPPVVTTVATTGEGVENAWAAIATHRAHLEAGVGLAARREARLRDEIRRTVAAQLAARADAYCTGEGFDAIVAEVTQRRLDPGRAASDLLGRADR